MAVDPLQDMPETPELIVNRCRPLTERSKIHPKIRAHPGSQNRVAAARERVCVGSGIVVVGSDSKGSHRNQNLPRIGQLALVEYPNTDSSTAFNLRQFDLVSQARLSNLARTDAAIFRPAIMLELPPDMGE
jgi:hypothetical protein